MSGIPISVAGTISIGLIVALGIFVYPWLLAQRHGAWILALMTVLLAALFIFFQGSGSSSASLIAAAAWALGPVVAGVVVHRLQRGSR